MSKFVSTGKHLNFQSYLCKTAKFFVWLISARNKHKQKTMSIRMLLFVRLPHEQSYWTKVVTSLSAPITNTDELKHAFFTIMKSSYDVSLLETVLDKMFKKEQNKSFFEKTMPILCKLVLDTPSLFPASQFPYGIPMLMQQRGLKNFFNFCKVAVWNLHANKLLVFWPMHFFQHGTENRIVTRGNITKFPVSMYFIIFFCDNASLICCMKMAIAKRPKFQKLSWFCTILIVLLKRVCALWKFVTNSAHWWNWIY